MTDMIAMEAFLHDQIIIENEDLLKKKLPLFVFCETDATLFFKRLGRLSGKYGFKDAIAINFEELGNYLMRDSWFDLNNADLRNRFDQIKSIMHNDMTLRELNQEIIKACTEYSKKSNELILLITQDYLNYSHSEIKECPIIMLNPSRVKLTFNALRKTSKISDVHFNRAFGNKIGKHLYVKHPERMQLFHVSMTQGIQELEPRKTNKPLNDYENMTIPRISATTSVDACFRAVSPRVGRWYIYQLQLTSKTQVVNPDTYLVPDADVTGEYWVLTPTKVKEIAVIDCKVDPDDKERFVFTTIKSATKENYENLLHGYKAVGG
ncbi:MAG: hypothetical protein NC548_05335 [Lachnospiraceae bacterium]|nr:hypothetical protein [Lachnospiraceae bacterium]